MASGSFKSLKFFIRNLILVFIALPVVSANVDCGGKAFHCVNSTHFMICVDLGGGVSKTIDSFIIPCPVATECRKTNRYECEFPKPVILETVTSTSAPDVSELPLTTAGTSETAGISESSATVLLQSVTGSTEPSATELFSVTTDISVIDKTESIKASSVINDPGTTEYSIISINSLNNNTEQFQPLTERISSKTHNFEVPLGVSETNKSESEFFQGPFDFTIPVTTEILGISTGTTKLEFSEEPHVQSDVIQEIVEITAPITTDIFQNLKDESVGNKSEIFEVLSDVRDNVIKKIGLNQDPTEAIVPITTEFIPLMEHTSLPIEISDIINNASELITTTAPTTTEIFVITDNISITNESDLSQSSNGINESFASQLLDSSTDGNILNTTEFIETSTNPRVLNKADVVQEFEGNSALFTTEKFQIDANDPNITEHLMSTTYSTVFNEFLTNETSLPELLKSSTNVSKPTQTEVLEASLDFKVLNKSKVFQEQDEIRENFNTEYFQKSTDTLQKTEHPVASTDSFKFQELDRTTAPRPSGPFKSSIDTSASTKLALLQALSDSSSILITTEPFQSTTDVSTVTKEDFADYKVQNETVFVPEVLETRQIIINDLNETDLFEQRPNSGVLNNSVSFPNTTSTSTPVNNFENATARDQSFVYQSTAETGISSNETTISFEVNILQTTTETNVMHTKELLHQPAETTFLATTELSQASTSVNGFNTTRSPQLHDNSFVTFSSHGEILSGVSDSNNVTFEQKGKEEQIEWPSSTPAINANTLSAFDTEVSNFNDKSNVIITDKVYNIISSSTSSAGESDILINNVADLNDKKILTTSNTPIDSTTYDTTESHFSTLPSQDLTTESDIKKHIETIDVIEINDFTVDLNVFAAFTPPTSIYDYSYHYNELQEKNPIITEKPTTFYNNALVSKTVLSTKETIKFTETNLGTINPSSNVKAEEIAQSHVDEISKGTVKVLKTTISSYDSVHEILPLTTNNSSRTLSLESENPVIVNLQPTTITNLVQAISSPEQSAKIPNDANRNSTEDYLNISQSNQENTVINDVFATNASKINMGQVAINNSIQMTKTPAEGIDVLQNISTLPVIDHQIKSSETTTETLVATTAKAVTQIRKTTEADEKDTHIAFSNVIANGSDMTTGAESSISLATVGINQELLTNTNIVENASDIINFRETSSSNFTEKNISESIYGNGHDKVITPSFKNNDYNINVVNISQATATEADLQHSRDKNTVSLNIPETNLQPFLEGNEDNNTVGLESHDNNVNSLFTPLKDQSAYETLVEEQNTYHETLKTSTRTYNDVPDLLQNKSFNQDVKTIHDVNKNNNDFIVTSDSFVTVTNAQVGVDSIPTKSLNSAASTSTPLNKMEIASPNTEYFSTAQTTDTSNISSKIGVKVLELNETKNDAVQTIQSSLLSNTFSEPSIVMVNKQVGFNNTTDDQSLGVSRAITSEVNLKSNDTSILLGSSKDNISENTFIYSTANSTNRDSVYTSPQVGTDVAAQNQTFVKGSKNTHRDTLAQTVLNAISGNDKIISNDEVRKISDTTSQVFGKEDIVTRNISDNLYAAGAGNESSIHLNIFNIKTNITLLQNYSTGEVLKVNSSLESNKTSTKTDIVKDVLKNSLSSVYNISYNFGKLNGSVNNEIENNTTSDYERVLNQTHTTYNDFINAAVPSANKTEYNITNSRLPESQNLDQDKLLLTKEERNASQNTEGNLTDSRVLESVSNSKGAHIPILSTNTYQKRTISTPVTVNFSTGTYPRQLVVSEGGQNSILSTNINRNGSTSKPVVDNFSTRIDSRAPVVTIPIHNGLAQATTVKKDIEQRNGTFTNGKNNITIARNSTQVPGTINTGNIMVTKTNISESISTPITDNLSTSIYSREPVVTIPIYSGVPQATIVKKVIGRRIPNVTNGNNNITLSRNNNITIARNSTQIPGTTDTGKVMVTNINKNGSTSIPVMDNLQDINFKKYMSQPNQTVKNGNKNTLARNLTQIPGTINAGNVMVTNSNKKGSTSTPLIKFNSTQTYPRQPVVTIPIYRGGQLNRTVANKKNIITTVRRTTQIPGPVNTGKVLVTNTNKNKLSSTPLIDNLHIVPNRVYSRQPVVTIPLNKIYRSGPLNRTVANRKNNITTTKITTQIPGLINTRKIMVPFNCHNRNRGRYSDPKDCNKFYVCIGRLEPIIGRCPVHTVFSDLKKQCTNNMSHCVRESEFKCLRAGRFSDIWQQNVYYICAQRDEHFIRYKFQCQNGYYLNKTLVKCIAVPKLEIQSQTSISLDSKSDISNTEDMKVKKEAIKTRPSPRSKEDFECEEEGKFADENDCRRYYICTKNHKSEFRRRKKKCDSDELFHKDHKKCVDAESYEC